MNLIAPANSLANLKPPWQGSGNPGGKPQQKPLTEQLRKELTAAAWERDGTKIQALMWKLVELAWAGDMRAMEMIFDRIEGKVAQGTGTVMLVQINSPFFNQDGSLTEPPDETGGFDNDGRLTIDVTVDETVVSEPTSTTE